MDSRSMEPGQVTTLFMHIHFIGLEVVELFPDGSLVLWR